MSRKNQPTKVPPLLPEGTFEQDLKRRLDTIDATILLLGIGMSEVCREAGVARSTPDRWRKTTPKSVRAVAALETVLAVKLAQAREQGVIPALKR